MKVTINWLKQYVDFNWLPEELTERLTLLGLEVEGVRMFDAARDMTLWPRYLPDSRRKN